VVEFETIYRTYFRDVELYLLALCKDAHLAEELTAQTFFQALSSLRNFRGDCDIRTWLCTIGRNCYLSHLRRNSKLLPVEELSIPDPMPQIEELVADKEQAMQIHRILHDLKEPYKEVFLLRVFGQLSFADIGFLFGKSQNWACVTYHRAKQKIISELEVSK